MNFISPEATPPTLTNITRITDWDLRFLHLAKFIGSWSKDPSTKTGAVIKRPDRSIASVGYNGFPRGVQDTDERLNDRPTKYALVVHAEANAILAASEPLRGFTCYVHPFPPCSSCAGMIVQTGIWRVVAPEPTDEQLERWGDSFKLANTMFTESGVQLDLVDRKALS